MPDFDLKSQGGLPIDYPGLHAALGQVPHWTPIHKFGGATTLTTVYRPAALGNVYPMPTSGVSLEVVSGSTDDAAGGTGARTFYLEGMSTSWEQQSETVTLGTTSSLVWMRLWRGHVATSGTYASTAGSMSHAGDITVRVAGGGATWMQIDSTGGTLAKAQSQIAAYTVPTGKKALVQLYSICVDSGKTADVAFMQRPNADTLSAPYSAMRLVNEFIAITNAVSFSMGPTPLGVFTGPCDLVWFAKAAATGTIQIDWEIIVIDE